MLTQNQQSVKKWLKTGSINIFGRPFAGKDLQATKLANWLNAPILGGGDIIRTKDEATHLRESHDRGELAPQDEFIKIVANYFKNDMFHGRPLVLSSIGRWHGEEEPIINAAKQSGHPIMAAIYIDISEPTAYQRFELKGSRGRSDDNHLILATRLDEFAQKTLPVINFYKQRGMLIKVDGLQAPKKVAADIADGLASRALAKQ